MGAFTVLGFIKKSPALESAGLFLLLFRNTITMPHMTQTQKNGLIGGVIAIIILLIGGYLYTRNPAPALAPGAATSTPVSTATTTSIASGGIQTTPSSGGYTISVQPISAPAPDFKAPLVFASTYPVSAQASLQTQFTADVAALQKSATDVDAWINIGTLRKLAGDNAGAAKDWEYASLLSPTNIVTFANLGDLYTNFLPDYPKAAKNYLQEIKNNPTYADSYRELFALYTNQYPQGTTTPANILKEGIVASPKSADLYVLLARYYAGKGDIADAKTEYQLAIAVAQSQSDASLVSEIQNEEAALPNQ